MAVLCIQETHMERYGVLSITSNYGKNCLLYYSGHQTKSVNGVGIFVEEDRQVNFEPILHRICKITIKLTNSGSKLIIMSVYAATLKFSEKDPDIADAFYNELESVIKNVKSRDNFVITGNFNAKTGTAALECNIYKKQIGIYRKGKANSNGYRLLELAKSHTKSLAKSSTNIVIDQHGNRRSKSIKLKKYREYHRIETRSIIYASKINQMFYHLRLKMIRRNVSKIRS